MVEGDGKLFLGVVIKETLFAVGDNGVVDQAEAGVGVDQAFEDGTGPGATTPFLVGRVGKSSLVVGLRVVVEVVVADA